jgi:hypothetical protein
MNEIKGLWLRLLRTAIIVGRNAFERYWENPGILLRLRNICIAPDPMFSATQRFRNFIRVSCGHPWSDRVEKTVSVLGDVVKKLM